MITSKELLSTYNLLDPKDKGRHAKHEFQAFAYKIAHDLNDLQNLKIYMMLAKNVERSLMERAYSYALDAQTDNRAKKFMWKLKSLREELKERINLNNYDYEFIQKEMKPFREKLASNYFQKKSNYKLISKVFNEDLPKKNKVLVLNCLSFELIDNLTKRGYKLTALDSSKSVKKIVQEKFEFLGSRLMPKITSVDIFKNKFKEESFNFIIINEFWCNLPKDSEKKFLKEMHKLLKADGFVCLIAKTGESTQEWKKYKYKEEDLKYFVKTNKLKELEETFDVSKFSVIDKESISEELFYLLAKE